MSHPFIGLIAFGLAGLYFGKVLWPDMRNIFVDLRDSERQLGPLKFTAIMLATLGVIGLFAWLATRLDFPNAYGHPCNGRGCLIHDIWYSPLLLRTHHWDEVMLFLFFWTLPASAVAAGIYALVRKLRGTKLSLYSDETE